MQQYTHTPETFNIFYNETNTKLKEHNDTIIKYNEKIEYCKETLNKYETIINRLETQNVILQEKNSALEQHITHLDKYVYDLNRMMLKFFAYGKQPKTINNEKINITPPSPAFQTPVTQPTGFSFNIK